MKSLIIRIKLRYFEWKFHRWIKWILMMPPHIARGSITRTRWSLKDYPDGPFVNSYNRLLDDLEKSVGRIEKIKLAANDEERLVLALRWVLEDATPSSPPDAAS